MFPIIDIDRSEGEITNAKALGAINFPVSSLIETNTLSGIGLGKKQPTHAI